MASKKPHHAWRRFLLPLAAATVPAAIGLAFLLMIQFRSYGEDRIAFVNNNRVNIQVAVQVTAAALSGLQFYAVSSVLRFRTNARVFASDEGLAQGRVSGMTLDALKIRSAVVRGVLDFDLRWPVVCQILVWWLLLKSAAPLWAGTITPKLGGHQIPGVVAVPDYNEETRRNGWGTKCGPNDACSEEFQPWYSNDGSVNLLPWKLSAGALQTTVATASRKTRGTKTSRYPRLDNTGYWYNTRSYGVGASGGWGLVESTGGRGVIQSYSYIEKGYWANVECERNSTEGWWSLARFRRGSFTFTDSKAEMHVGWAWADLPNGQWEGSQVWSQDANLSTSVVIASSSGRGKYMYGFVAGDHYERLRDVQCTVIFKPTTFRVLVNDTNSSIRVETVPGSNEDMDPTHDLIDNAFRSVSYMSQTMTTLYTSVLGDAFNENIGMFTFQDEYGDMEDPKLDPDVPMNPTEKQVMRGIEEGLEVLLDYILATIAAGHLSTPQGHSRWVDATLNVSVVKFGEVGYIYTSAALGFLVLLAVLAEMARVVIGVWRNRVPRAGPSLDILDIKSAILGTAKGAAVEDASSSGVGAAVSSWSGQADDAKAGELVVTMEAEVGMLKLTDGMGHLQRKRMSQFSRLGYQSPVESQSEKTGFGYLSPIENQTEKTPFTKSEAETH
ncbi:hypothetical protein MAPG_11567 [Magnaporthiopsis poae ATCC 64411]|uniref:Uncharacterized protein n=1 Tax=Magnaporthiopsis poae (strain ATCC 64411 / 73-15) TaxID=644358 RepID=A0A0C4EFL6_MAGP6|nr:hypothetical protein MAPG_11567 [Magnaporthiopsis poae ATCC 64411]